MVDFNVYESALLHTMNKQDNSFSFVSIAYGKISLKRHT
jgi:hypothetical protein